jgi:Bifunctional DNA primase/polymerase, N-terminal
MSPSVRELYDWFRRWPDAGTVVVLGPASDLFAIDVDGREAHDELVRRIGCVPTAPTVQSGSGKPYQYHLFFSCPSVPTKAKATPWHPQLEFRGNGGIIVLPPALHKSGYQYRWAPCKSLSDVPLLPPPKPIVDALGQVQTPKCISPQLAPKETCNVRLVLGVTNSTRQFLASVYADSAGWNGRLFRATCDMAGNGVPIERAMPLLLAGARPWDSREEALAIRTIESAYSQPRLPARLHLKK